MLDKAGGLCFIIMRLNARSVKGVVGRVETYNILLLIKDSLTALILPEAALRTTVQLLVLAFLMQVIVGL